MLIEIIEFGINVDTKSFECYIHFIFVIFAYIYLNTYSPDRRTFKMNKSSKGVAAKGETVGRTL